MIEISFEIGGQKVSPNCIGDEIEKAVLKEVIENVKKALSSIRCSEHGQYPKVTVKGKTIDKLTFEVQGCCQPLIDAAMKKLK